MKSTARPFLFAVALAGALVAAPGCSSPPAGEEAAHHAHADAWSAVTRAVCVISPTEGNQARGVVTFTQSAEGVQVVADVEGLTPGQKHGFHIHEWGDVTGADGKAAGGHYNPDGHDHAGPDTAMRHAGDLGNLTADESGKAHLELTLENASVAGLLNPIVGRGMIVHAGTDDLQSQPTGDAGGRIGQGVIGVAKP
ncbi:MAG: superoxide dismutase family protein [Planctomycetota bacterium]